MQQFIDTLPKVELHVHLEGTLEPALMFQLAERNSIDLPYPDVESVRAAYEFKDLQSFLNLYYNGARVLQTEQDFYDLTWAYLRRCADENVVHTEMFFDPQTHTERGIPFETVVRGIARARADAEAQLGLSTGLILCFLRDLSEESATETFRTALPWREHFVGIGLDSAETGHPPEKFERVFAMVRDEGFHIVAHAGEEGPPEYIWQAIRRLGVERVDHGVQCAGDADLVEHLRHTQTPLTVCPLANVKLKVFDRIEEHNLPRLLEAGLKVTINSDDPAYFGGYMNANFRAVAEAFDLDRDTLRGFTRNAIDTAFVDDQRRRELYALLDAA